MQGDGHNSHVIGSISPALAESARAGHPLFHCGKRETLEKTGHPASFSIRLSSCHVLQNLRDMGPALLRSFAPPDSPKRLNLFRVCGLSSEQAKAVVAPSG